MGAPTSVFLPKAAQPGHMVRWAWPSSPAEKVRAKGHRRHEGLISVAYVRPKRQSPPPTSTWLETIRCFPPSRYSSIQDLTR